MIFSKIKILNKEKESLDVWIEGKNDFKKMIIFVHGLAASKHYDYFDTATEVLKKNYTIIRFDFSGTGKSEGKLVEKDLNKWSDDLKSILYYVRQSYLGKIYIIAHSMGTFVTALASPAGIEKTIFTGTPNSKTGYIIDFISQTIIGRPGGRINYLGESIFPRSSGKTDKIGPSFWGSLKSFNPINAISSFSKKTKLIMIHMKQDQIIGGKYLGEYQNISDIKIKWLDGDHSFTKTEERKKFIEEIKTDL